jgi:hypothetical protein
MKVVVTMREGEIEKLRERVCALERGKKRKVRKREKD